MNVQRLNDVADRTEKYSEDFDQATCTKCVAAQVLRLFCQMPKGDDKFNFRFISERASRLLGISSDHAEFLFAETWPEAWFVRAGFPQWSEDVGEYAVPTAEAAVLVLRSMAKHPDDWPWPSS